jgi:hypothetical protein
MFLRLAPIVPAISEIAGEIVTPDQACACHAQPVEIGFGQIAYIESEALCLPAIFDDELKDD